MRRESEASKLHGVSSQRSQAIQSNVRDLPRVLECCTVEQVINVCVEGFAPGLNKALET
jgi:hypothetical protein